MRRWLPWLALAAVLAIALAVGAGRHGGRATPAQRAHRLAGELRCPTCRSLSAAESDAKAARAVRAEIARRVRAGESDGEIRAYFVSRYGRDILLEPEGTGVAALVWVLPVAAVLCALAGLAVAFRRWRVTPGAAVSDEDRARVEKALRS